MFVCCQIWLPNINTYSPKQKEQLILSVQKYESLWDLNSCSYHDKQIKMNCWKKVAEEFGCEDYKYLVGYCF